MRLRSFKNEKGSSIIEFAIVLPLLMLVMFGIVEFGLLLYNKAMITNATREGARVGAVFQVSGTGDYSPIMNDEISAVVNSYLENHLVTFGTPINVIPNITPCPQDRGLAIRQVTVDVPFTYTFLTLPNLFNLTGHSGFPLSIDLSSVSIMRCE